MPELKKRDLESTIVSQPQVNSANPVSLTGAIFNKLRSFSKDESSGFTPEDIIQRASDLALGKKIAPGLLLSHTSKKPSLHLHDVPVELTLKDFEKTQNALINCLKEHQSIEGISPSSNALRVLILMLRNLPEVSKESAKALGKLKKEALAIDLDAPLDPKWGKNISVQIGDTSLQLDLTIKKVNPAARVITMVVNSDIPAEERGHKYSYHVDLRLTNPTKTKALTFAEYNLKRAASVALTTGPALIAGSAVLDSLPHKILPKVFSSSILQSIAENGIEFAVMFSAAYFTYSMINTRLQRRKIDK